MSKRETAKSLESRLINFIYRLEEEEEEYIYSPNHIIGEMLFEVNEAKLLLEGVHRLLKETKGDE